MSVVHGDGVKAEEPAGIRREGGGGREGGREIT